MLDTSNLSKFLKGITDAIRAKKGTTEPIEHKLIDEEIANIQSGGYQSFMDKYVYSNRYNKGLFNTLTDLTEIQLNDYVSELDFSKFTTFDSMFYACSTITTIPQIDTHNGKSFKSMFYGCSKLKTIPQLDTSNGTNFNGMFNGCNYNFFTSIPQLDTSNGIEFSAMFYGCYYLKTIPQIDTSRGTNFYNMFCSCSNLLTVPQLDTSNGTRFSSMFKGCTKLTTIPLLNLSNAESVVSMFSSCNALKSINFVKNSIKRSISFSNSSVLDNDSIQSIIDGLAVVTTTQTLTFHATVKSKLTDEQIATINEKGWTLA